MNTPITFELAKLLKEKGFNEPCQAMWQKNQKLWNCRKNDTITNFVIDPEDSLLEFQIANYPQNVSLINGKYFIQSCVNFTAPTIAQVVMWLYEKHDVWISLIPDSYSAHRLIMRKMSIHLFRYTNSLNIQVETLRDYKGDILYFNWPTKAYEAAIEYILKNLK